MANTFKNGIAKLVSIIPSVKEVKDTAPALLPVTPKPEVEVASKITPKVAEISVYVAAGSVAVVAAVALVKLFTRKGA